MEIRRFTKNTKDLVQYWNLETKYRTTLSSSLLKSVLTDLYTESKERVWQWQLILETKYRQVYIRMTDSLSSSLLKSELTESDLYTESKERWQWLRKILRIYLNPWISQYLRWNPTKYCKKSEKREGFQSKYCEKYCNL